MPVVRMRQIKEQRHTICFCCSAGECARIPDLVAEEHLGFVFYAVGRNVTRRVFLMYPVHRCHGRGSSSSCLSCVHSEAAYGQRVRICILWVKLRRDWVHLLPDESVFVWILPQGQVSVCQKTALWYMDAWVVHTVYQSWQSPRSLLGT